MFANACLGYVYFNQSNPVAVSWRKYMPVSEEDYFSFLIPACIALSWAFFMKRGNSRDDNKVIGNIITSIKKDVLDIPVGTIRGLYIFSLLAYSISPLLPEAFRQVFKFSSISVFILPFFIYFIIGNSPIDICIDLQQSHLSWQMHCVWVCSTIIAYMGGILLILLLAEVKIKYYKRLALLLPSCSYWVSFRCLKSVGVRPIG